KSHNIRAFALAPGFTDTAMGRQAVDTVPEYTGEQGGLMKLSEVTDAFVAAVREPDNAGRLLRIVMNRRGYYSARTPLPSCFAMELSQIVGIVTGGAVGFGRGFAEAILNGGGKVLITDIDVQQLEATGKELQSAFGHKNVAWQRQNVTDPDGFHAAFDFATKYFDRPVNVLVNNAGIGGAESYLDDGAPHGWERIVDIDITSVLRGSQVAIDYFKKLPSGQEGVIVNLASLAGLNAVPMTPVYAAAKAGVVGLTRSLYQLKKSDNIRAFALAPGFARTAMGRQVTDNMPDYAAVMGGVMEVDEVVEAFVAGLREPDNAGRILRVSQGKRVYYRFPGDKQLFPNSKL
ncbi:hypothetical protein PybrP1_005980, partial [[Pythium] brassicae (nom. inval.)]